VGTPLEGVPLRLTFTDDMRNGYTEELQEYMRVPLSRFTTRLFYNKTLLKQLTGKDEPPTDYRGFLAICEEIKKHKNARGQNYIPVACSSYHIGQWQSGLFDVLTYGNLRKADFNRDGTVGNDEFFAAIRSGGMSFSDPPITAKFKLTADMLKNFQDGFTGLNRDDALFPFAQQRAVFISSGTWDAFSIRDQARGDDEKPNFEVGVINYPLPSKDDPEFGKLVVGPKFDQAGQGFPFGLTNFSKHQDVAKEFLLFLASVHGNTELNGTIGWIPSVRTVPLPEMLEDFAPTDQGMYSCYNTDLGGKSILKWNQVYSKFQNDRDYGYEQMLADFAPVYKEKGLADWMESSTTSSSSRRCAAMRCWSNRRSPMRRCG
jgi:raffinose/stachyose/melibiose transport system substrate-binding protein